MEEPKTLEQLKKEEIDIETLIHAGYPLEDILDKVKKKIALIEDKKNRPETEAERVYREGRF